MIKILHTADLHIGEDLFATMNSKAAEERYKDIIDSLNQISDIAIKEGIDAVVIAGDIFNRVLPSGTASLNFSEFVKKMLDNKTHVIIIRGNHDRPAVEGTSELLKTYRILLSKAQENYFHYLSKIESLVITTKEHRRIGFVALPYYPTGEEYDGTQNITEIFGRSGEVQKRAYTDYFRKVILDKIEKECSKIDAEYKILMAHVPITGSIPGSERIFYGSKSEVVYGTNEICKLPFDYVALGHFHVMQMVGAPNCRYSGSIFRLTFDEPSYIDGRKVSKSEKGVILVEEKDKKLLPRPIALRTRDLCIVHLDYLDAKFNPVPRDVEEIVDSIRQKAPIMDAGKPPYVRVVVKIVDIQRKMFDEYSVREKLLRKGYLDVKFEMTTEQSNIPKITATSLPVEESLSKYVENLRLPSEMREDVLKEALKILKEVSGK